MEGWCAGGTRRDVCLGPECGVAEARQVDEATDGVDGVNGVGFTCASESLSRVCATAYSFVKGVLVFLKRDIETSSGIVGGRLRLALGDDVATLPLTWLLKVICDEDVMVSC